MQKEDRFHPTNIDPGITVRDYIAIEAMKAMISGDEHRKTMLSVIENNKKKSNPTGKIDLYQEDVVKKTAEWAYMYADGLIEQSEK